MAVLCAVPTRAAAASGRQLAVSPETLDFQTVAVGQQASLLLHINNTGSTTVQVYSVSSSKSEFRSDGPSLPISLAPSESIDFRMIYEPTATGKTSALLEIASSAQAMQSYTLTGIGKEASAALQVSPTSLNFGSQKVNSLSTKNITVLNAGDSPLTISGVTVMGSGFGFSNVSPGLSLAPKEKAIVQVSFRPLSGEVASGKLTILGKNLAAAATLPLAGSGVSAVPAVSPLVRTLSVAAPSVAAATPAMRTAATSAGTVANAAIVVPASTASTLHPALASTSAPQTVHLQWGASASPVTGYRVYRGPVSGGPYADQTSGALPALEYVDNSVAAGASYYYVVTSVDSTGVESKFSNEAKATLPGSTTTPPPPPPPPPPPGSGPTSLTTGIAMNGSAALNGTRLRLTNTGQNLAGSGWFTTPVNVQMFSNDFTFQIANTTSNPVGNGITFVIQNTGTAALGPSGGGLGYGPDAVVNASGSSNVPIAKSVAVKFDTVNNAGEGPNSTGLYINGASPTEPAVTVGGGVNLHSGDIFKVHMSYDGNNLKMTITDTVNPTQTCNASWTVNIPGTVGANTAFIGFTGATGYSVANQDIISWTYSSTAPTSPKTPIVYRSTNLAAASSGPTFRSFAYSGFPDATGTILDATAAKDNVTFTVNVPAAGTYDISLSYKQYSNRGISQLAINGTSLGAPLDQYLPAEGYARFDYGSFVFPVAGNYSFKFTILGKDVSATGYSVSFDDLTLTPQ